MKFFEFDLVRTCCACPEQYDVFLGERQVGYLRLRHGYFRVDFPECGGKTIYSYNAKGDGIFDNEEERYEQLVKACDAIRREMVIEAFGDINLLEE